MMDQHVEPVFYCRACRRALNTLTTAGVVTWCHTAELRGQTSDHRADPIPLAELPNPIMECDFCTHGTPTTVYLCADQYTHLDRVTRRFVALRDYHRQHRAARTMRTETEPGITSAWGQRWSACDDCAALVERRDLYGLIWRVTEHMPPKLIRGNRLARTRAHLHAHYSDMFTTLVPARGRITPEHPLGEWDDPPPTRPPSRCQTGGPGDTPTEG